MLVQEDMITCIIRMTSGSGTDIAHECKSMEKKLECKSMEKKLGIHPGIEPRLMSSI